MACRLSPRLPRPIFAVIALVVLWCRASAPLLHAQSFDATNLRQPDPLNVTWLAMAGDDPAYARPDYDDSKWVRVDTSRSLLDYFPGQRPEIVWHRLHIKVAPNEQGPGLEEWALPPPLKST